VSRPLRRSHRCYGREEEFRLRWAAGDSLRVLQVRFQYQTPQAVTNARARLGLPPRRQGARGFVAERVDEFTAAWMAGMKCKEIAPLFGFAGASSVRTVRQRLGLPPRRTTADHDSIRKAAA
jgi:hypothetical protein